MIPFLLLACHTATFVDTTQGEVSADAGPDVFVTVGVEAVLDGSGSAGEAVTWTFDDGSTSSGPIGRHTWPAPGHFVAVVTATSAGGLSATDAVRITVTRPAVTPAPRSSSAIAVDPARNEAWVAVPDADVVTVIDLNTRSAVPLAVCARPRQVAIEGAEAAITCDGTDELVILSTVSRAELRRVRLGTGTHPWGVVGRDDTWWVTGSGNGQLYRVREREALQSLMGEDGHSVALSPTDAWYAPRSRSRGFGGEVYAGVDEAPATAITLQNDPGPDTGLQHRGVPTGLDALAITPDGQTLFVGGHVVNDQRGPQVDGEDFDPARAARATLRSIDLASGAETGGRTFDDGEISAIAPTPLGDGLWLAFPGSGALRLVDAYTLELMATLDDAGQGVNALAFSPDGALLVHAWLDREVRAFDVTGEEPALLWSAPTVDVEPLAPGVLRGKQLFFSARDPRLSTGDLSCATCHPDGGDDGQVWDLTAAGEGLRNTISLHGHTGPLRWTGSADEVQDIEGDVRHLFGGAGLIADDAWLDQPLGDPTAGLSSDLDALAAYVATLTTTPTSPWITLGDGADLFARKGCGACHDPDTGYTDSSLERSWRYDVGTITPESGSRLGERIDGFDTPSLLGVWATAPYLHDGSASNLESAIGAHEVPGLSLTPQEKVNLAAFVRTL